MRPGARVCLAVAMMTLSSAAGAIGPGQSDKSRALFMVVAAFPVVTTATASCAVLFRTPAQAPRIVLRGMLGATSGLILVAALAAALMSDSARDVQYFGGLVFVLGAAPAGLVGLIVGALAVVAGRGRDPS